MDEDIKKKAESGHLSAVDRMERRMANSLANAKKNGIASSRTVAGMAAYSKSSFIDDFDSVYHQPNVVQQSFRLKVLGMVLLLLTLLNTIVYITVRPGPVRTYMDDTFGSSSGRLSVVMILFCALLIIYKVKYWHPFASILMVVWIVLAGLGVGVLSLYASSYGFIQILLYVYFTLLLTIVLSQFKHNTLFGCCCPDYGHKVVPEEGETDLEAGQGGAGVDVQREEELVTCLYAGLLAFLLVFIGGLIVQIVWPAGRSPYHFVSCIILSFLVIVWTMYDTDLMHFKMSPDEWNQAPVFFFSDLLLLFSMCCLIAICCCTGGGSEGGGAGADVGVDSSEMLMGDAGGMGGGAAERAGGSGGALVPQ